jgi:hypothetical protein
MIRF